MAAEVICHAGFLNAAASCLRVLEDWDRRKLKALALGFNLRWHLWVG